MGPRPLVPLMARLGSTAHLARARGAASFSQARRAGSARPLGGRGGAAGWRFWRRGSPAPRRSPAATPAAAPAASQEDYSGLCQSAGESLAAGRAADAATAARRALRLLPRGLDAQRTLGLALLELGEYRQALSALTGALACDPHDVVAQVGVAEATEALHGAAEAEPAWQRAWEIEPGLVEVEERLQAARRAAGALDHRDGAPAYTRAALARVYLRGGMYEHAAAEASAVLAREPDRPDLQLVLAEAHWRAGDLDSAAAVAGVILERYPDCVAANLLLAAQWQTIGRDPAPLVARVRAVDPAGRIAARLFDDRELPAALEELTGKLPSVAPAIAEAATAAAPEPTWRQGSERAVAVVPEIAPAPATVGKEAPADLEAAPAEPLAPAALTPVSVYRGAGWVGGPAAAAAGRPATDPEVEPARAHLASPTLAPRRKQPTAVPDGEPRAAPVAGGLEGARVPRPLDQPELEAAGAPGLPEHAAARAQGDAFMRAGRYRDALRAYGAALRALRMAEAARHEAA